MGRARRGVYGDRRCGQPDPRELVGAEACMWCVPLVLEAESTHSLLCEGALEEPDDERQVLPLVVGGEDHAVGRHRVVCGGGGCGDVRRLGLWLFAPIV